MDGTPNAATFGSPNPDAGAYGNNSSPSAPMNNAMSPMVQQLQNFGRNNDTQLVHMTPGEVGGLQALARAHGGSLTINPHTGLPEAGFLENILPTLLGVGLSFIPGVGPLMAAGITGLGTTAVTGDLKQGLMAGLGAFGGASLAGGLGIGAASGAAAVPGASISTTLPTAVTTGAVPAAAAAPASLAGVSSIVPNTMANASALGSLTGAAAPGAAAAVAPTAALTGATGGANAAEIALRTGASAAGSGASNPMLTQLLGPDLGAKAGTFGQKFANSAGQNVMGTATNPSVMKTGLAAMGVANPILSSMAPEYKPYTPPESKYKYEGPYKPQDRKVRFPTSTPTDSEFNYFEDSNPYPGYLTSKGTMPEGFADGGSAGPVFSQTTGGIEPGYMPQAAPQAAVNPAQFSALQAGPAASIFAPAQTQTYGTTPTPSGAGLAQLLMPQAQKYMQSMEHAKVAGPMTFEPFKTEKQVVDASKPTPKPTPTPTPGPGPTPTPTPGPGPRGPGGGGGPSPGPRGPGGGGGRPDSGTDTGYDGNGTEVIGDPTDGYYGGNGGDYNYDDSTYVDETGMNPGDDYGFTYDDNGLPTGDYSTYGGGFTGTFTDGTGGGSNDYTYDPNQEFQLDPNVDYTGGMDLGGMDFSNIGGLGGSYNGNYEGYDAGQDFVNNMDLSGLDSYSPEQYQADMAAGNYGGSDINGNPFGGDFGGTGDMGGNDIYSQSDYGNFQPGSDMSYNGVDYSAYSPANYSGMGNDLSYNAGDYGGFSPSDYYGMDTSGGFDGIGNDFGFDQGDYGLFAKGGQVPLEDGAFIVDARTVSELGNGSSRAGQDLLAKYGGKTLRGPGDGVSDSIHANIGGQQAARVARDEVKFSPQAVARIGGGDLHKGTKKLYAMMDRAQKARQSAQRGQNTGLQGILSR